MSRDLLATKEEIGSRLRAAGKAQGVHPDEVMPKIGAKRGSWYAWTNGEVEGGCVEVPALGLLLGMSPNELLLKNPGTAAIGKIGDGVFDGNDYANLARIHHMMVRLTELNKAPKRVTDIIHDMLFDVLSTHDPQAAMSIPAGSSIRVNEDGVKTIDAPPENAKGRRAAERRKKAQ